MSYQCCVAGKEQSSSTKALCNQSFLAKITLSPHHHQCFALHIQTDPYVVTQQWGGHIHQGILWLKKWRQEGIKEHWKEYNMFKSNKVLWVSQKPYSIPQSLWQRCPGAIVNNTVVLVQNSICNVQDCLLAVYLLGIKENFIENLSSI